MMYKTILSYSFNLKHLKTYTLNHFKIIMQSKAKSKKKRTSNEEEKYIITKEVAAKILLHCVVVADKNIAPKGLIPGKYFSGGQCLVVVAVPISA